WTRPGRAPTTGRCWSCTPATTAPTRSGAAPTKTTPRRPGEWCTALTGASASAHDGEPGGPRINGGGPAEEDRLGGAIIVSGGQQRVAWSPVQTPRPDHSLASARARPVIPDCAAA